MGNWDNVISRIVTGVENKISSAINSHNSNNNSHTDIRASVNDKVDKENGKGLSTNDYTTAEKDKLDGIEDNANNYVHPNNFPSKNNSGIYNITTNSNGHITSIDDSGISITYDNRGNITLFQLPYVIEFYTDYTNNYNINNLSGFPFNSIIRWNVDDDRYIFLDRDITDLLYDVEEGKVLSSNDYTTIEKSKLNGIESGANNYTHPSYTSKTSGLYKITVDALGHVSATASVTGSDLPSHNHSIGDVNNLQSTLSDLSNRISSVESLEYIKIVTTLPSASSSTMNTLYLLSKSGSYDIYITIKDGSTYYWEKLDEDILDDLSIDWADIENKPSTYNPSSHTHNMSEVTGLEDTIDDCYDYVDNEISTHTHGGISNTGAIGNTANLPLITTTNGVITTGAFGSSANTFCQGNDSRLSDARTPLSHTHGNITNTGSITTSKSSIISNDKLIISDSESSNVLKSASVVDVLNRVVLDLIDEAE